MSLTSKQTFKKFLDHKIYVINKEHIEEEGILKYLLNITPGKPQMTLVGLILAVIALNCTKVGRVIYFSDN